MAQNDNVASTSGLHDLTELTFQRIHGVFSDYESMDSEPLHAALTHRSSTLKRCYDPFPKPSPTSRKTVESGSVTLRDGTKLDVPQEDKDLVWEISGSLDLDEIESLVLLRLFIVNESLSPEQISDPSALLHALTDFYFEERLFAIRIMGALLRSKDNDSDQFRELANEFLGENVPNLPKFAQEVLNSIKSRTQEQLRANVSEDPRQAARWAKQNMKEQLGLMEIIFWAAVALNADGGFVLDFFQFAANSDLGRIQRYSGILLDEESARLGSDMTVLFGVTGVQLLKLDKLLDETLNLELITKHNHGFLASPEHVNDIHNTVSSFPEDMRFAPLVLAWGYIVSRIEHTPSEDIPHQYDAFYATLHPNHMRRQRNPYTDSSLSVSETIVNRAIMTGFLTAMLGYLRSPLLSTSLAAIYSSHITEPNNEQFRYIIKCLLMALIDTVQVDYLEEYETLVQVWSEAFGSGEMPIVVKLCSEFWMRDLQISAQRRSLLDLALSRFPVEITPVIRLLRALSGTGGLAELHSISDDGEQTALRTESARQVYAHLADLTTFTQVLDPVHLQGPEMLYDTRPDIKYGFYYTNTQPIRLPGGSLLPAGSTGRVISNQGAVVVAWTHSHSGWHLMLDVLRFFLNKRTMAMAMSRTASSGTLLQSPAVELGLNQIGVQVDKVEDLVADIMDLFRSLFHRNLELTGFVIADLDVQRGSWEGLTDHPAPIDMIQITLLLVKDLLTASPGDRSTSRTRIMASSFGVLTALLPVAPGQIWPFLRSLPQLFGDERQAGLTPILLNAERAVGEYGMTLALLDLVGALFDEAFRMLLTHTGALQQMKLEVLARALAFIHSEIWVDYSNWKYVRLGDRFEIGTKLANIYSAVLKLSPPVIANEDSTAPSKGGNILVPLTHFILDLFLVKATSSTITPIAVSISSLREVYDVLRRSMRYVDVSHLILLLGANLRLIQLVLARKPVDLTRLSLLEQMLLTGPPSMPKRSRGKPAQVDPVEAIAGYVQNRTFGPIVTIEAVQTLSALCTSTAAVQPRPPSILGHLSDPEAIAKAYVHLLDDPYEHVELRKVVWQLMSVVVDTQPALVSLFLFGNTGRMDQDSKRENTNGKAQPLTALNVACEMVASPQLWDLAAEVQSAAFGMLDLVWQHALQHLDGLFKVRSSDQFWLDLGAVASRSLGPPPKSFAEPSSPNGPYSYDQHNHDVAQYAYHAVSKAHAIHILALDLKIASPRDKPAKAMPASFRAVTELFKSRDELVRRVTESLACSYTPSLHADLQTLIADHFPNFNLDSVRTAFVPSQRSYGDQYMYQSDVAHNRLMKYAGSDDELTYYATTVFKMMEIANLDWSLTDSQTMLMRSWSTLLHESAGWLKTQPAIRTNVLSTACKVAELIAQETRRGDLMQAVHLDRLQVLQGLLEVAWLSAPSRAIDADEIVPLVKAVRQISSHEGFPLFDSIRRHSHPPFHRTLLRIIFFCARKASSMMCGKAAKPENKLSISSDLNEILGCLVDGLRYLLDMASEMDPSLLTDLQLLVSAFDACTHRNLHSSPAKWLERCQEVSLIRASLDLLVRGSLPQSRGSAASSSASLLYMGCVLHFHVTLARIPLSAEKLAREGVLGAYTKTEITPDLQTGSVNSLPTGVIGEIDRSHQAWNSMLAVTSALVHVIGVQGHFLSTEVSGFVQLYGGQLTKVLGWTIETASTVSDLAEIKRVTELFYAIAAASTENGGDPPASVQGLLTAFNDRAIYLLQQLNYALSHPNHLASLLTPMTFEERVQLEKESQEPPIENVVSMMNSNKRPVMAQVIQSIMSIVRDILFTLTTVGRSDDLLCATDSMDWMRYPPQIQADSTVMASGPASLGTLRELTAFALDVFRQISVKQETPRNWELGAQLLPQFDPVLLQDIALEMVENGLIYSVTQLSSIINQPLRDNPTGPDGGLMELDRDSKLGFSKAIAPDMLEHLRQTRQWKDAAVELNLLAKDVPQKAGPSAKLLLDEIAKSTYKLVQSLDRSMKDGR